MRLLLIAPFIVPLTSSAQDSGTFARALRSGTVEHVDRWMKHEIRRHRMGHVVNTPSTTYVLHSPTFDSLVSFLRRQPGVHDAAWDGCVNKIAIWPGYSTIGLRVLINGVEHERCYRVQEGIPGAIHLFGWRPHLRKNREHLKYLGAEECPGFADEQRRNCRAMEQSR